MEINTKKKYLSHIIMTFIMLLFAICLTMNVLFSSNYSLYELLDKTNVIETRTISESIITNESDNNTIYFKFSFLDKNSFHTETIIKNICPESIVAAIPKLSNPFPFLIIIFHFFFLNLFILLPDAWTLINQRVRLDN